ncbi:hypothetical protein [Xanthomonas euvesicatoria]|uniref:hypothetical protein n=1 Tax=Xanthomonas euvesicatoria TaxID=456327 RepID=UPI001E3BFF76|nr:hypothetical protein [Xanthomonas euvesicatoria]
MGTFSRHPDLYIIIAGAMGAVGQTLSIKAYSLGNISTLSTVKFIQLPTMTFLGYVVYGQTVGWSVFVGGSLIFLANYMSLRLKSPVMEPIGRG